MTPLNSMHAGTDDQHDRTTGFVTQANSRREAHVPPAIQQTNARPVRLCPPFVRITRRATAELRGDGSRVTVAPR